MTDFLLYSTLDVGNRQKINTNIVVTYNTEVKGYCGSLNLEGEQKTNESYKVKSE